jgi:putative proteasome-type protease
MTYCLGVKLKDGLLAIADTRITSGTDKSSAKKIFVHQSDH